MSRQEHTYLPVDYQGPAIPLCQHVEVRHYVTRNEAVKCAECNRRSRRLAPWDAARFRSTERFMGTYFRFESGMVLLLWYGEPEPEMVWDLKTRRRLK